MQTKNKKTLIIGLFIFITTLFISALLLLTYQRAYAGKIFKNTYFEEIDLSGKTRSQAKTIVQNRIETQFNNTIITKSEEKQFEATIIETGATVDTDQLVREAYNFGRDKSFFKTLYFMSSTLFKKNTVSPAIYFDEDIYQNYLNQASESLNIPAIDASLSIKNGQVVTNSGQNGIIINTEGLKDKISTEFLSGTNEIIIEMPTEPVTPILLSDNLSQAKADAEKYLTHQIQLTIFDQVYSANSSTISDWISFKQKNGKYTATLDNSAIKSFINKAAVKNDISVIDTKISAVDNSVIQEGRQGVYINQDEALAKITAAMNSNTATAVIALTQITKDPQIVRVFPTEGIVAGRFEGRYIDIDLNKQLLTLFDGAVQVAQYIVSSGKASTPTPTGTRTISGHSPKAWSAAHGLYMPWWMSMGGGYGIHELPEWPGGYKEGEAHLGTPVSHGCVRLGVGAAQTVYNWSPDGTPVYIHK